jgi:hypothetical protein
VENESMMHPFGWLEHGSITRQLRYPHGECTFVYISEIGLSRKETGGFRMELLPGAEGMNAV